jgi:hypothetical protein
MISKISTCNWFFLSGKCINDKSEKKNRREREREREQKEK